MRGRIIRQDNRPAIPVVGKVKCGEKRTKNGKEFPVSLDYFRPDGQYESLFRAAFGPKPTSLTVMFHSDHFAEVCREEYTLRSGAKLYGTGDGETFRIYSPKSDDYETFLLSEHKDLMERAARMAGGDWKISLTLRFILPQIRGVLGLWQLVTHGAASSVPNIVGAFDEVLSRAGTVVGVPFDLQVKKVTSQKPGSRSSYPVIQLVPNAGTENLERVRAFIEGGGSHHEVRRLIEKPAPEIAEYSEVR